MEFRIFPYPEKGICTPFVIDNKNGLFIRGFSDRFNKHKVVIKYLSKCNVMTTGIPSKNIIGTKLPNRRMILKLLKDSENINSEFYSYVKNTFVIPTFPINIEEALVKTVIRQVITVKQAKLLYSSFIKQFGSMDNGIYYFPNCEQLKAINIKNLKKLGLGFKADRIYHGLRMLKRAKIDELDRIHGIGTWSQKILEVETKKSYSYYPFWDLSGFKIKKVCGIDVQALSMINCKLAGDIYIYASSFMEYRK
ncbi:MAG: hypothetical protein GY855_03150 [candidate division Zixibacteria bacterium]|nr:hypothetical protein [candidate division Zixibacteria bacterium]